MIELYLIPFSSPYHYGLRKVLKDSVSPKVFAFHINYHSISFFLSSPGLGRYLRTKFDKAFRFFRCLLIFLRMKGLIVFILQLWPKEW